MAEGVFGMIGKKVREAEIIVKNRIRNRYYWIHPEKLNFKDGKIEFEYHGPKPLGYLRKNHSIFGNKKDIEASLWEQSKILRNKKIQDMNQKEMIEEYEVDKMAKHLNSVCSEWYSMVFEEPKTSFDDFDWPI